MSTRTPATRLHPAHLQTDALSDHLVLDVRSEAEFAAGSLPGAHNTPLDRLEQALADLELELHERDVVLVCRSGARAQRAADALAASGASSLKVLDGGLEAASSAASSSASSASSPSAASVPSIGWSTPASEAGWGIERQVRLVAGSIVATSILVSTWKPKARFVAGGIGAGLTVAALSGTCAMGAALGRLPFNRPRAPRS